MSIWEDFDFGKTGGEAPFDVDDLGPLNDLFVAQESQIDDIGVFVRQVMQTDQFVMSVVVTRITFACMLSGQFSYQQIGNLIAKILVSDGGFHRVQNC